MGYFSARPVGPPFRLFGTRHLLALAGTGLGVAGTIALGRRQGEAGRRATKAAIIAGLWGQEVAYHAWKARHGAWNRQEMLPLHLCSVLVWAGGTNLIRPTQLGDDITWFWGLSGAPQALLTPDLADFGDRHFRFHQFFISHGFLLTVPLWQVFVEGRYAVDAEPWAVASKGMTKSSSSNRCWRRSGPIRCKASAMRWMSVLVSGFSKSNDARRRVKSSNTSMAALRSA